MEVDFSKENGLVPAIIQDSQSLKVLMLGYMNEEALAQTLATGKVTFFSRSRGEIWVKGETSGNFLFLQDLQLDCDQDTLLVKVQPAGPVCHQGTDTCWGEDNSSPDFLLKLEEIISDRIAEGKSGQSYVASLVRSGINKVAQKVGEEAVELVIEAKDEDDQRFLDESADLLFHYLILLQAKGCNLEQVKEVLRKRNSGNK